MENLLLDGEEVLLRTRPEKKTLWMWFLPIFSVFFLGPLGFLLIFFLIKTRSALALYGALLAVIIFGVPLSMLLLLSIAGASTSLLFLLSAIPIWLILSYLGLEHVLGKIQLILTDRRIIFTHGFITDFVHSVAYDKVSDVKVTSGAYENIFGLKSVILETLAGQRMVRRKRALGELVLEGLKKENMDKVQEIIMSKMKKPAIK